ncbi:glycosyltransferase family 4 protein [Veillonella sp. R32]|uniref:glycosyltransferase family 4 protein n=1 Tax=Veillonella sp. R32 TaxID=2021312 RepID=UPI00138A3B8C|nr:glycosyltransferase family 4 protein [Veillonella sp. R32]KAF1683449.1 hypothetical protein VER_01860 [Veillonella sp. R32]
MKVLHLVCAKVWGGGEQYVYDIAAALKAQNIESIIVVDTHNTILQERFKTVAKVVAVNLYQLNGLLSYKTLKKICLSQHINIINVHSGKMTLLGILLKQSINIPIVLFKHSATRGKTDFYHRWLTKQLDAIICVSQLVYDLQQIALKDSQKHKLHLVYNGIWPERLQENQDYILPLPLLQNPFFIGYAGRLTDNKGIDILLKALRNVIKKYPQVHLLLAGMEDKNYGRKLNQLIVDLHIEKHVTKLGLIQNMGNFYKVLSTFVLPSKVKESFGLVLCESMYNKIYTITSNSGAQREIISDTINGRILDPFNEDTLTNELFWVIEHPTEKQVIAEQGQTTILKRFTIDITASHLSNIYHQILGS